MNTDIILCGCHTPSHHIIVYHDTEDNIVYAEIKLNPEFGFLRRLKEAFRYVIKPSSDNLYASIMFTKKDAEKIKRIYETIIG